MASALLEVWVLAETSGEGTAMVAGLGPRVTPADAMVADDVVTVSVLEVILELREKLALADNSPLLSEIYKNHFHPVYY